MIFHTVLIHESWDNKCEHPTWVIRIWRQFFQSIFGFTVLFNPLYTLNAIVKIKEFSQPSWTLQWPLIWDAIKLMWYHCNVPDSFTLHPSPTPIPTHPSSTGISLKSGIFSRGAPDHVLKYNESLAYGVAKKTKLHDCWVTWVSSNYGDS